MQHGAWARGLTARGRSYALPGGPRGSVAGEQAAEVFPCEGVGGGVVARLFDCWHGGVRAAAAVTAWRVCIRAAARNRMEYVFAGKDSILNSSFLILNS